MKLITQDGTIYPLTQAIMTIGRDPGCDIALVQDARISRQHAQLQVGGGQVVVVDLNSRNGTLVNGVRLTAPHTLRPGDVVTVGGTTFTFQVEQDSQTTQYAPPAPVPPPAQPVAIPYPFPTPTQPVAIPYPVPAPAQPVVLIPYPVPTPAQPVAAPQPGPYPGYAPRPRKGRALALALEIIFGLFGLLGIGWIYAGNLGTGLVFMFVYLGLAFTFIIADVVSSGICCLVTLPIQFIIVILSIVMLNGYINKRTDLFG